MLKSYLLFITDQIMKAMYNTTYYVCACIWYVCIYIHTHIYRHTHIYVCVCLHIHNAWYY